MYNSFLAIYFGTLIGLLWLHYTDDIAQYLLRSEVDYILEGLTYNEYILVVYLIFLFWPIAAISKLIRG